MKPLLTITREDWVALCLVVLCVTPYGCKDSASVSDKPDVPLASLSVTPATLLPAFSSETTSYTAQAPTTATSVTVTATPQDSTVTVSIDGTIGTQRSIALDQPGSTKTIPIVLTTQTGTDSTYSVRVTRLLSGDNNLKTLTVTPGSLSPLFDPTKPDYTLDVATNISTVTIAATKADPGAVLSGTVSNDGRATIQLDGPGTSKAVSIIVTAPNGESKTYRITINRAASSNNNLSALRVQVGTADQTLSPGFTSGAINYRVDVGTTVTSITITATKADPLAVISGGVPNEGQATIPLDGPGTSKVVLITVTAQDATTSKTYRITVNRAASSNNNLSALSITPGPLEPLFAANTLDYTVNVAHTISAVVISATKEDPNAVISGSVPNEGQATIPLDGPGTSKVVLITVTAQDATTSKTYRVTVNRRASNDSSLSALTVSAGTLDPPFASNILNYTVQVGLLVGSVTITATKTDPNAIMSSLGSSIAAAGTSIGQVTVSPALGVGTTVDLTLIAQDGINRTEYKITVTRGLF
ncbi:MAG: cadherin-like beta sandwich domain-containing protein [Nitrospira sp.]|jgi:hypothetical protein|nr:cadherin-like beta sandwich domain-containing protein [Nitrospira sp.]